jgi:hypothetical protein
MSFMSLRKAFIHCMLHVLAMLLDAVVEQLLASLREEIATFSHLSTKTIIPLYIHKLKTCLIHGIIIIILSSIFCHIVLPRVCIYSLLFKPVVENKL